jgi:predicted transcriptional regulator YheO
MEIDVNDAPDWLEIARDITPEMRRYVPMVSFVSSLLGPDSEVLLHDVRDLTRSIVAIANGAVSGRSVGGPATDLVLQILKDPELRDRSHITNYRSQSRSGISFKSHTLIIRDGGQLIGMICVNTDIRKWIQARELLSAFTQVDSLGDGQGQREHLDLTADELTRTSIDRRFAELGVEPALMSAEDRSKLIARLHDDGVFLLRGAIRDVAERLGVSEATIYRQRANARRQRP